MKLTTMLLLGAAALANPAFAQASNTDANAIANGSNTVAPNQSGTHAPQMDGHQNAGTEAAPAQTGAMTDIKSERTADATPTVAAPTGPNQTMGAKTAAADTSAMAPAPASTQMSASSSTTGSAKMTDGPADTSSLTSVPDTAKKYKRSARAKDFDKEAETTRQLNQHVASNGGLPKAQ